MCSDRNWFTFGWPAIPHKIWWDQSAESEIVRLFCKADFVQFFRAISRDWTLRYAGIHFWGFPKFPHFPRL